MTTISQELLSSLRRRERRRVRGRRIGRQSPSFGDRPVQVGRWLGLVVGGLFCPVLGGCQGFATEGLEAIGDNRDSYVVFPGKRAVRGEFHSLGWNHSVTYDDRVVLGLDSAEHLTIASLNGGSCTAGVAAQYLPSRTLAPKVSGPGFVAYTEALDEQGFGRLHFVDHHCEEQLEPPLEAARLFRSPDSSFPAILATTREGALISVSPGPTGWASTALSDSVTDLRAFGGLLWSVEGGQLIVRDSNLKVVRTLGKDVHDLVPLEGLGAMAYADHDGLHLTPKAPGMDQLIATDACGAGTSLPSGDYLTYYSPCAEKRLVARKSKPADPEIEIALGAASSVIIAEIPGTTEPGPHIAYLTDANTISVGLVGTLWIGPLRGERTKVAENVVFDSVQFGTSSYVRAVADWNGHVGRLLQWEPGFPARELAQRVASAHPNYQSLVLVNYDGLEGDRARISVDGEVNIVVRDTASRSSYSTDTQAFLTDFDGNSGTLTYYSPTLGVRPVVANVGLREFSMVRWKSPAVTYRREYTSLTRTGILGVRFPGNCDTYEIPNVSEWQAVRRPQAGILYATAGTSSSGIWFAQAQ